MFDKFFMLHFFIPDITRIIFLMKPVPQNCVSHIRETEKAKDYIKKHLSITENERLHYRHLK